ncbi:MAG: lipopolysaccharide heptosyltransferase II [Bryobacterales bacterium]
MKLLVRATNWLGDAVMSIPALREIRRSFPGSEIVVLARPWVADLYRREDFCDRILTYENRGRHAGARGKLRLAGELRRERFDCAILLQNALDAAVLTWLARIPKRIGYARDGRRALLTEPVAVPHKDEIPEHQRYYYLELLRRAGLMKTLPECREIRLAGAAKAADSGRSLWRQRGFSAARWIGVSPGAAFGGAKRWLPERFAESAAKLSAELDAEVAVFGSAAEAELCESVASGIGPRAHSLAGKTTLAEFIDFAAACTVYLTNDSGPMHVASALGVPTVAVFGATDHIATGPTNEWARIVRQPVECSPCLLRECPIDHRCMTRVESAVVVAEAQSLLAAGRVG